MKSSEKKDLSKLCVLVVEDNTVNRKIMEQLLKQLKITHVISAVDGADGIEKLKRNPDVTMIITDYNMPKKNGGQLVTEARKLGYQYGIIGVSAEEKDAVVSGEAAKNEMLKCGANAFIRKESLKQHLQTTLENVYAETASLENEHYDVKDYPAPRKQGTPEETVASKATHVSRVPHSPGIQARKVDVNYNPSCQSPGSYRRH